MSDLEHLGTPNRCVVDTVRSMTARAVRLPVYVAITPSLFQGVDESPLWNSAQGNRLVLFAERGPGELSACCLCDAKGPRMRFPFQMHRDVNRTPRQGSWGNDPAGSCRKLHTSHNLTKLLCCHQMARKTVYSMHKSSTREHVIKVAQSWGCQVAIKPCQFPVGSEPWICPSAQPRPLLTAGKLPGRNEI